jgi:hypothetical protein
VGGEAEVALETNADGGQGKAPSAGCWLE